MLTLIYCSTQCFDAKQFPVVILIHLLTNALVHQRSNYCQNIALSSEAKPVQAGEERGCKYEPDPFAHHPLRAGGENLYGCRDLASVSAGAHTHLCRADSYF